VGRKGRPEVGDDLDRWAPPVGGCVRERGREGEWAAWAGEEMGRRRFHGPLRKKRKKEEKGRGGPRGKEGGWAGPRVEVRWVCFFLFFQIHFKPIFQPFLNQIFYIFSNSNFNTNFSNYFKGFSQTIFNNFSNIF
jgi:hypothetical protein